jgi:hypothetical protein
MYDLYLRRAPDPAGAADATQALLRGVTPEKVVTAIMVSNEYASHL